MTRAAAPGPGEAPPVPLLEVSGLKKHFPLRQGVFSRTVGHVYAVDGVSFSIGRGGTLIIVAGEGSRTISQKNGIPVIDVCNGIIDDILGGVARVTVEVSNKRLRITPLTGGAA